MATYRPPTDSDYFGGSPSSDFAPALQQDQTVQAVQQTAVGYFPLTLAVAAGDMFYASGAETVTTLTVGASGGLLYSNGSVPSWLAQGARGSILEVGATGTGWLAVGTRGALMYAGANDPSWLAIGAQGGVLYSGASDPAWTAAGAIGTILYNSAAGTPAWLGTGTSGYVLTSTGAAAPSWQALPSATITVDNNGSVVGSRAILNLIPGTGVGLQVTDNAGAARVDVTITSSIASALTTVGDIPYVATTGPTTYGRLAGDAAGKILLSKGIGVVPGWSTSTTQGSVLLSQGAADPVWSGSGTSGYVLTSQGSGADPVWATPSTYQASPSAPSTTTSATDVMMGLAGSITATRSQIQIQISYVFDVSGTTSRTVTGQIRYGTGAAPVNGAAAAGTAAGTKMSIGTADFFPVTLHAIVTGLIPGTTYWLDLAVSVSGGSTLTITVPNITACDV